GVLADDLAGQPLFSRGRPSPTAAVPPPAALLARLSHIDGVQSVIEVRAHPGLTLPRRLIASGGPAGLVSCAQLARVAALGHCPAGAATVAFPQFLADAPAGRNLARITWPGEGVSASQLSGLDLDSIDIATNGSQSAVEQARTALETTNAYPAIGAPLTLGELSTQQNSVNNAYQQLADVVILTSLPIAGCTLAAAGAAGLADRKRPFSMLRLTGARLGMLRRVIALESAVPLLTVAVVSIGVGFAASAMFASVQLQHTLVAPGAGYYLIVMAGIAASLGIIAATFPLLRRITGPETARNE
ncbi:MAG: ABC transporter permease, partial [Streptosporangiaceae bacterium]